MEPASTQALSRNEPIRREKEYYLSLRVTLLPDDDYAYLNTVFVSKEVFSSWPKTREGQAWGQIGSHIYQIQSLDFIGNREVALSETQRQDLSAERVVLKHVEKPTQVFTKVVFQLTGKIDYPVGRINRLFLEQTYSPNVISPNKHLNMIQFDGKKYKLKAITCIPDHDFGIIDDRTEVSIQLGKYVLETRADEIQQFVFNVSPKDPTQAIPVLFSTDEFVKKLNLDVNPCWIGKANLFDVSDCSIALDQSCSKSRV